MSFANLVAVLPFVKTGQLRALAITTAKRSPAAPDIPTMQEAGVSGYDFTSWFGMLAPTGTPREILYKLNSEIGRSLNAPEVQKQLSEQGADLVASSPSQFAEFLSGETTKWADVIRAAGIQPN